MQRKLPPKKPRPSGGGPAAASRNQSSIDDIPLEFREMMVEDIQSRRQVSGPSTSQQPQPTGQRKKPLTRRVIDASSPTVSTAERPISAGGATESPSKKRKLDSLGSSPATAQPSSLASSYGRSSRPAPKPASNLTVEPVQTSHDNDLEDDSDADDDDDDFEDVEWENVDLSKLDKPALPINRPSGPVSFDISNPAPAIDGPGTKKNGRKGPTPAERKIRLEVHKLHLLCLLSHAYTRSHYCNDTAVQDALLPIVEKKVLRELKDRSFDRSKILKQGLSNAAAAFKRRFKVTCPGTRKALWGNVPTSPSALYGDVPMAIEEFRDAAKNMSGSRDLAAQLFCATMRRAGLDARLVCSLQPLSYLFKGKYSLEQSKRHGMTLMEEDPNDYRTSEDDSSGEGLGGDASKAFGGVGTNFRAAPVAPLRVQTPAEMLGLPQSTKKKTKKKMRISDPALPIWWVEVFDVMQQTWLAVDPLGIGVTRTYNIFEPPQTDAWENEMAYVVAFDNENRVRDITRKYVKAYNGVTRSLRVDATLGGTKWWKRALRPFSVRQADMLDRDQVENALMDDKLLREGLPKSRAAMKNHPVWAIEEQLRKNEVIHPKRQSGTMPGKNGKPIPVYRREDVKIVKSARQWYMLGRAVFAGEQPLKHKKKSIKRRGKEAESIDPNDSLDLDEEEEEETGMYAEFQTGLYEPEPCIDSVVPRNAFGTIDLFVPSMLPRGCVHVDSKFARVAANFLGIGEHVAEAVVGFDFRARGHSQPIFKGIVAAQEHEAGLWAMIEQIEVEETERVAEEQSFRALTYWKTFLIALRIKQRVDEYAEDNEETNELGGLDDDDAMETDEKPMDDEDGGGGGGFIRNRDTSPADDTGSGGFFTGDLENFAGKVMRRETESRAPSLNQERFSFSSRRSALGITDTSNLDEVYDHNEHGGGFVVDDDDAELSAAIENTLKDGIVSKGKQRMTEMEDYGGGGFIVEDDGVATNKDLRATTLLTGSSDGGQQLNHSTHESEGGGFLVGDGMITEIGSLEQSLVSTTNHDLGGGFIVEDSEALQSEHVPESLEDKAGRLGDMLLEKLEKGEDVDMEAAEDEILEDDFEYESD